MGTIQSGGGFFSGIDTNQLIQQLLAVESRPKLLAQQRIVQLQAQQAGYLDLNSALSGLRTAASAFRTQKTFDAKSAASSADTVLGATASTTAAQGSYTFVVDRLVSSQQTLTRGFSDRDRSAVGIETLTLESSKARLDRDAALADFNNGTGIDRGKIKVNGVDVDLSRAATVQDVLTAINGTNGLEVTATFENGRFVLDGATSVVSAGDDKTAETLGLDSASATVGGGKLTGKTVYGLGTFTALADLNDGRGVEFDQTIGISVFDLSITVGTTQVNVRLGDKYEQVTNDQGVVEQKLTEAAATTAGQVVDRINAAFTAAGVTGIAASIDDANGRLRIVDSLSRAFTVASAPETDTAEDLGIAGSGTAGTLNGRRVFADANTTLVSSLNGGAGIGGDGILSFALKSGTVLDINVGSATTVQQIVSLINNDSGNAGKIRASLNDAGNGMRVEDLTTGSGTFQIGGTSGSDTAASLGLSGTYSSGVARGANLQLAYLGRATRLEELRDGTGIGAGQFRITDGFGNTTTVDVFATDQNLGVLIDRINDNASAAGVQVRARINDRGDGLVVEETGTTDGTVKIKVEDLRGTAASDLRIEGEASGTGASNFIDGSYEVNLEFEPDATLDDVVAAVNEEGLFARATVINDGVGSNPFRLSLSARASGVAGRFVVDAGGFDLGLTTLDAGNDARMFYGSSDPADGVLLSSSTNAFDGVITGVTLDVRNVSEDPVTVSVTTNTGEIESKIDAFVEAFNTVLDRVDFNTRFNQETGERGALLGDGTAISLSSTLISRIGRANSGFTTGVDTLARVGVSLGDGGRLSFDREAFRDALEEDPEAVEALFTTRTIDADGRVTDLGNGITVTDPLAATTFTELGVIVQIEEFASDYISSVGGILTERGRSLDTAIASQNSRIEAFDVRLAAREQILRQQFLAMEQAIGQLQTQSSALSQLG